MTDHRERVTRRRVTTWGVPSVAVVATFAVIAVAAVAFFVTGRPDAAPARPTTTTAAAAPTATPAPVAARTTAPKKAEALPRAYVEIFNNSTISGLADATSAQVQDAGWKVVGVDNWYGNIPATTIYYPKRLKPQAELLAHDLDVNRVKPAVSPMRSDRLTMILTGAL